MYRQSIEMDYQNLEMNTWMIDKSGRLATCIKNYLIDDGIPEDGAIAIIDNAAKVLGFCPDPAKNEDNSLTGIVIGKVQSGKTSNFISLTALAFDNGYNCVVVFGGTKKVLVKQNSDRINEYFEGVSNIVVLNTTENKNSLTEKDIEHFIKMGKKVIIVALKTPKQINVIRENVFSGNTLSSQATLIIDDEGDEASLNTLVYKGKKSSTYLAIENLKSSLKRHCFVSVTATPQANLLISSVDILSPNFGVLVDPGNGYCGLDVFHTPASKYVVEIPENESSLLDKGVPNSFYQALASFFVACGIFDYRGKAPKDKLSMLVHPSQLKVDHKIAYKKIEAIINDWRDLIKVRNDIAYSSLKKLLVFAHENYQNSSENNIPKFEVIEDRVLRAIDFCGLHIVNGDSVPNGMDKHYDYNIYVGGAMLGRGLTLKGLAVTYIICTSKGTSAVDTVQQRARWFGYKKKYLDLCRVFAVKKIIKEFKDIREHENDLWETVREANLHGTRFKDIARIFLLSDDLKMTRTAVGKTESYTFKPWNIQRSFQIHEAYAQSNINIINDYKERYKASLEVVRYGGGAPFVILPDMRLSRVKVELFDKFMFPDNSKLNGGIIEKLSLILQKKKIDPLVDVIWMRDGNTSKHNIDDGDIPEFMVGRRPDDYSKPAVYEGDRKAFIKPNVMQVQIHMIEDNDNGKISPTFAIYLPNECIEKLTNLVIRA